MKIQKVYSIHHKKKYQPLKNNTQEISNKIKEINKKFIFQFLMKMITILRLKKQSMVKEIYY